jgi:hypothetical protein
MRERTAARKKNLITTMWERFWESVLFGWRYIPASLREWFLKKFFDEVFFFWVAMHFRIVAGTVFGEHDPPIMSVELAPGIAIDKSSPPQPLSAKTSTVTPSPLATAVLHGSSLPYHSTGSQDIAIMTLSSRLHSRLIFIAPVCGLLCPLTLFSVGRHAPLILCNAAFTNESAMEQDVGKISGLA